MRFIAFAFFISVALLGCELDSRGTVGGEARSPSAEPAGKPSMSAGEKQAFYRWLVSEMHEQIFLQPAKSKADIESWASIFSQGASIEGVYHGLVLSKEYAELERGKANLRALRWFAAEMAWLDDPEAKETDPAAKARNESYAKQHISSSLFTLKRELGERLLGEVEKRKASSEKLASWYASIAARWAKMDVSFGMASRNRDDFSFHRDWAKENSLGLVQWELLNRAHRILNDRGGVAVAAPSGK